MKTSLQAALVAASAVLLAACASSGGLAKAPPGPAQSRGTVAVDSEYMAIVEQVANRRGVQVRWFNPPLKHAAATETRTGAQ